MLFKSYILITYKYYNISQIPYLCINTIYITISYAYIHTCVGLLYGGVIYICTYIISYSIIYDYV